MTGAGLPAFDDSGGPDGPPLLLLHGLGGDRRMWADCVAIWRHRRRCISVDFPGAGQTALADDPLDPPALARSVTRLCARLGLQTIIPVGCAVGSMVAATLAAQGSIRAAALVMVNPMLRVTPEAGAVLTDRAARVRAGGMAAILPAAIDRAFEGLPHDHRRAAFAASFAAHDPEGYARLALGFVNADLGPDCARIACPTLFVPGANDRVLPDWHVEGYLAGLADARSTPVPGGHFLPVQRPEDLAGAVSDFLDDPTLGLGSAG